MAYIEKRVSQKTGRITYRVQVRVKGAECQSATFNRLTDAREWGRNTESAPMFHISFWVLVAFFDKTLPSLTKCNSIINPCHFYSNHNCNARSLHT